MPSRTKLCCTSDYSPTTYLPRILSLFAWLWLSSAAWATEYHGQILFGGLPVAGATVTAVNGDRQLVTASDLLGNYSFSDIADGTWKISVEMTGFARVEKTLSIAADVSAGKWDLTMLPKDQMLAQAEMIKPGALPIVGAGVPHGPPVNPELKTNSAQGAATPDVSRTQDRSSEIQDALLINGTSRNAATSQYSIDAAFGNTRKGANGLYTGGLGLIFGNSALDARPYSITGQDTPKASYNRFTGTAAFGGPLNIPEVMPKGPNFFVAYQWTRNRDATIEPGLVPTLDQRDGMLSTGSVAIDPVAQALLNYYPLPNVSDSLYNYQTQVLNNTHQDALQLRMDKSITQKDQVYGVFAFQSTRADDTNLFGFRDTSDTLGMNANLNWVHHLNNGLFNTLRYQTSRIRLLMTPNFAGRLDVSGIAGVKGNDLEADQWGPPTLVFANSGISSLDDATAKFNRNRTEAIGDSVQWYRGKHNYTFGGDFRRQEFNYQQQANPRGTFTFLGATDFAHFLQGTPDTSALSFGNGDKYLRQSVYDAYFTDDWRLRPNLTLNLGVRWEYGAPITELKDRLANIDVAPGFTASNTIVATNPASTLNGQIYPNSLIRPDRNGVEPRIGLSWRPLDGSSVVVRAGYGIYQDTSVYQLTALQLAQQSPFASSLNLSNSPTCPLTLANGFRPAATCPSTSGDTFGVDPNFRVGYAQTWQLSVQRDLPFALQMTATYNGVKGTRGVQKFLPNTYPIGAANPCPLCPTNFVYLTSSGDSIREAASLQLRRRLRSGFSAMLMYTYSKSIDDDSVLGGQGPVAPGAAAQTLPTPVIAQDWLNLKAERGLSSFDQRHLLNLSLQYTSGMGLGGEALMTGWRGRLFKEWTTAAQIVSGSGLPETPIYLASVPGTGFSGTIRASVTGQPVEFAGASRALNPAAFSAPTPGQWGNAGRSSLNGPQQFTFNSSLSRTFRLNNRFNLDARVDATNLLNHGVFTGWNNVINSSQFGVPVSANPMRSLQTTLRVRF